METKNWIVRYYDKKDNLIDSHIIHDCSEQGALDEAIGDMPFECEDWTLVPYALDETK